MRYAELVDQISAVSGHSPAVVREVIFALPDILIGLGEGEQVRTPLGVFRMMHRKERTVTIPTSVETLEVPAEMVVKMKPGTKLRRRAAAQ